jgi:hypothetical protein
MRLPAFGATAGAGEPFSIFKYKSALQAAAGMNDQLLLFRFNRSSNMSQMIINLFLPNT